MIIQRKDNGKALVDGDIICYMVAAACDGRYYTTADGSEFKYKREAVAHAGKGEITLQYEPEEWDDVVYSLEHSLQEILEWSHSSSYQLYLTGKSNFRYSVATIKPYKGHRIGTHVPYWLSSCKEYLIREHDAILSHGVEADDLMGLAQGKNTIICSSDKDLLTIPGKHYNLNSKEIVDVSEIEAAQYFYIQMLTGDTSDNILGLHNMGTKSAAAKKIRCMDNPLDMGQLVMDEYLKRFGSYAYKFYFETYILLEIGGAS